MDESHGQEVRLPELREPGSKVSATVSGNHVTIRANREGMVTLSRIFLYMTQKSVRPGTGLLLDRALGVDDFGPVTILVERE